MEERGVSGTDETEVKGGMPVMPSHDECET